MEKSRFARKYLPVENRLYKHTLMRWWLEEAILSPTTLPSTKLQWITIMLPFAKTLLLGVILEGRSLWCIFRVKNVIVCAGYFVPI